MSFNQVMKLYYLVPIDRWFIEGVSQISGIFIKSFISGWKVKVMSNVKKSLKIFFQVNKKVQKVL